MAGVDGDDDVAPRMRRRRLSRHDLRVDTGCLAGRRLTSMPAGRHLLLADHRLDRVDGVFHRAFARVLHVHDQTMSVLIVGRQGEMARFHFAGELQHHAQAAAIAHAAAHGGDGTALQVERGEVGVEPALLEVDDQPTRVVQGEDVGLGMAGKIEHQARMVGRRPQADIVDLSRLRGHGHVPGCQQEQAEHSTEHGAQQPLLAPRRGSGDHHGVSRSSALIRSA